MTMPAMFLLIDSSQKDQNHLALFDEGSFVEETFARPNRELLSSIDEMLAKHYIKKEDVAGIMVVVGTGSFTSTRIATTIANTFAYTFQIPLLAIQLSDVGEVQSRIPLLLKQKKGHYISATYSAEASIGGKK